GHEPPGGHAAASPLRSDGGGARCGPAADSKSAWDRPAQSPDHPPYLEGSRRHSDTAAWVHPLRQPGSDRECGARGSHLRRAEVPPEVGGDVRPIGPATDDRQCKDVLHGGKVRQVAAWPGLPPSDWLDGRMEDRGAVRRRDRETRPFPSHGAHLLAETVMRVARPRRGKEA